MKNSFIRFKNHTNPIADSKIVIILNFIFLRAIVLEQFFKLLHWQFQKVDLSGRRAEPFEFPSITTIIRGANASDRSPTPQTIYYF